MLMAVSQVVSVAPTLPIYNLLAKVQPNTNEVSPGFQSCFFNRGLFDNKKSVFSVCSKN